MLKKAFVDAVTVCFERLNVAFIKKQGSPLLVLGRSHRFPNLNVLYNPFRERTPNTVLRVLTSASPRPGQETKSRYDVINRPSVALRSSEFKRKSGIALA